MHPSHLTSINWYNSTHQSNAGGTVNHVISKVHAFEMAVAPEAVELVDNPSGVMQAPCWQPGRLSIRRSISTALCTLRNIGLRGNILVIMVAQWLRTLDPSEGSGNRHPCSASDARAGLSSMALP